VPSAIVYCEQPAPDCQSHHSTVQLFPSLGQLSAAPPLQLPPLQESFVVQTLPSSQPPVLALCEQYVLGEQVSSVHGLPSSQFVAP
jgi:hypothetical protein